MRKQGEKENMRRNTWIHNKREGRNKGKRKIRQGRGVRQKNLTS